MLKLLLNPSILSLAALMISVAWMLKDEKDKTRPLLVIAFVINLFYGLLLTFVMGKENGLVPWKYDYILAQFDHALGLSASATAARVQGWAYLPLVVVYHLMVPMMIAWVVVARTLRASLIMAYVVEMVAGPLFYALLPACGPIYAFHAAWLNPPLPAPHIV